MDIFGRPLLSLPQGSIPVMIFITKAIGEIIVDYQKEGKERLERERHINRDKVGKSKSVLMKRILL